MSKKLKPMSKQEFLFLKKTANAMLLLQLAFDNLQFLPDTAIYKQRNKQKIQMILEYLDKEVNDATNNMLGNDLKNLNDVTDKVRSLLVEFELSADKYLDEINRRIELGEL